MAETDDVIEIQRQLANKYRAEAMARAARLKKDVRSQIAKAGHYQPDNDPDYEYREFPKVVRDAAGKELGVANDHDQEMGILGVALNKAKAVSVDLAKIAPVAAAPTKRKYVRKSAPAQPLPAPLE